MKSWKPASEGVCFSCINNLLSKWVHKYVQHLKIIKIPGLLQMEGFFLLPIHKSNIVQSCTKLTLL